MSNSVGSAGTAQRSFLRRFLAVVTSLCLAATLVALTAPSASAGKGNSKNPPGNPDPKGQLIDLQLLAVRHQ